MALTPVCFVSKDKLPKPSLPILNAEQQVLLNTSDIPRYMNYVDAVLGSFYERVLIDKNYSIADILNPDNAKTIYTSLYKELNNDYVRRDEKGLLSDKTKENLDVILDNWDLIASYHLMYKGIDYVEGVSSNIIEDLSPEEFQEENVEGVDENDRKEEWGKAGNEENPYDINSKELRLLLSFLVKKKLVNNELVDDLTDENLPQTVNPKVFFDRLLEKTAGIKNEAHFISLLKSDQIKRSLPEIIVLNKLLDINNISPATKSNAIQFEEFRKVFTRPIIALHEGEMYTNAKGELEYSYYPSIKGNLRKIEKTFASNFYDDTLPVHLKQYKTKTPDFGVLYLQSLPATPTIDNFALENNTLSNAVSQVTDFLSLIGIKFSNIDNLLPSEKSYFVELLNQSIKLHSALYDILEYNKSLELPILIKSPLEQLRSNSIADLIKDKQNSKYSSKQNAAIIKQIIAFESKHSALSPTMMNVNANGEPQSDISIDNSVSTAIYYLNSSNTLDELYQTASFIKAKYSPLFESSRLINHLYDGNKNRIKENKIYVHNYNGFKFGTRADSQNFVTADLTDRLKLIANINTLLVSGIRDTTQLETAKTYIGLQLTSNGTISKAINPQQIIKEPMEEKVFEKTMLDYLKAEITRIQRFNANKDAYKQTPGFGEWNIFNFLETEEEEAKENSLKKDLITNGLTESNKETVYTRINNYFNEEIDNLSQRLLNENISFKDIVSDKLKLLIPEKYKALNDRADVIPNKYNVEEDVILDNFLKTFVLTDFINNADFTSVFTGEAIFFPKGDMTKRNKIMVSTKFPASISNRLNNFLSGGYSQAFNDIYSISAVYNTPIRDNSKNFLSHIIKEEVLKDSEYTKEWMSKAIQASIYKRDAITIPLEEILPLLKEGQEIKVGDGQGIISMDFHRELSFKFSFNTENLEVAYKYQGLYLRKYKNLPYNKEEFDKLEKIIFENPDRHAIPVIKAATNGSIENDDVMVNAKTFHKFSLFPVLPTFSENHPKMATIQEKMAKGQIAYMTFESGSKQLVRRVLNTINQIGEDPDILSTESLGEQVKTIIQQKSSSTLPTQMVTLLVANLFSEGKTLPHIKTIYDNYLSIFKRLQIENKKTYQKKIGYETNSIGRVTFNPKTLVKLIQDEITRRNLPSTLAKGITIVNNNGIPQLANSLESTGYAKDISTILTGILDKNLRRFKLPGADMTLVSDVYSSNKLKFFEVDTENGVVMASEIRMTLTKNFLPLLNLINPYTGEKIGNIQTLNKLLKDKKFRDENIKALTVIFGRPPIGGVNSLGFGIITEFIHPLQGNVMFLANEFISKAGVAFDFDKEKVIFPSLSPNGTYISTEEQANIKQQIYVFERKYSELYEYARTYKDEDIETIDTFLKTVNSKYEKVGSSLEKAIADYKEYYYLKNNSLSGIHNELIQSMIDLLSLEENFADLVTPNDTTTLNNVIAKHATEMGNKLVIINNGIPSIKLPHKHKALSYLSNLDIFRAYNVSKNDLGIYADNNKFSELLRISGTNISDTIILSPATTEKPATLGFFPRILIPDDKLSSVFKNGKVVVSKKFNVENELAQHILNELINLTVDAAKDPKYVALGITRKNINVAILMLLSQHRVETVIDFINNPVIKQYDNNVPVSKILFSQGIGKKSIVNNVTVLTPYNDFTAIKILKDTRENTQHISSDTINSLKINEQQSNDNLRLLQAYIDIKAFTKPFRMLQTIFNFDTNKVNSIVEVRGRNVLIHELVKTELVNDNNLSNFLSKIPLSSYNNDVFITEQIKNVFPLLGEDNVIARFSTIYSNELTKSFDKAKTKSLPTILNNDILKAVIDNFGEINSQTINEYAKPLLLKTPNSSLTVSERLQNFRQTKDYQKLKLSFPIFDNLLTVPSELLTNPVIPINNSIIHQVSFLRMQGENISETESYINQFEQLINPTLAIDGISQEYIDKMQQLVKDILLLGYYQQGMGRLTNTYFDLIPPSLFQNIFETAVQKFLALPEIEKEAFMDLFNAAFYNNNPKFARQRENVQDVSKIFKMYAIPYTKVQELAQQILAEQENSENKKLPIN